MFLTDVDVGDERGMANLRKSINFDMKGDKIKEVPWLSFWVYTCNKEFTAPSRSDYLSLNDQNNWNYEPNIPAKMQKYASPDQTKSRLKKTMKKNQKKIYVIQSKTEQMKKIQKEEPIYKLARLMKQKKHRKYRKH